MKNAMRSRKNVMMIVSIILLISVTFNFAGCSVRVSAADLMEGITAGNTGAPSEVSPDSAAKAADFAVRLFKKAVASEDSSILVSPLSVFAALSMTANGAKGETKDQMEKVLGIGTDELNQFFFAYMKALPDAEKYRLSLANSIWFTSDERFTVDRSFLQTNADYYGVGAYKAPFDGSTLNDINNWVSEKTEGMIPRILDSIPDEAVMYLVNALAFDAEWAEIYNEDQVREGIFTDLSGEKHNAEFMYSSENRYLEDGYAKGFIKYYSGRKYAFAALLPNEGVGLADYIESLDGRKLHELLANPESAAVQTAIPKFETEYGTEMSGLLKDMGMPAAFDPDGADFSGLGKSTAGNIYINRVIHRTFISVGEKGTRAGAATVVEMVQKSAIGFTDVKEVILDRPFVYMLIDTETNLPFFIGALTDLNG